MLTTTQGRANRRVTGTTTRPALVDALMKDCLAVLGVLDGAELDGVVADAAQLVAIVAGQGIEQGDNGIFRIARRVAKDRIISTVDVEARHGHESHHRRLTATKRTCRSTPTPS